MDLKQALDIVLELAVNNMINPTRDPELNAEFERQSLAMTTVQDFLRKIRKDAAWAAELKVARAQGRTLVRRRHNPEE